MNEIERAAAELEVHEFDCAHFAAACRERGDLAAAARWTARRHAYEHAVSLIRESLHRVDSA